MGSRGGGACLQLFLEPIKINSVLSGFDGVVYGVESVGDIHEGEGCDRPFSHIKEKIILNIKEGSLSRMMFSVSWLKPSHKASFIKVGLKLDSYYPFENS